jgi:hypothetical protein
VKARKARARAERESQDRHNKYSHHFRNYTHGKPTSRSSRLSPFCAAIKMAVSACAPDDFHSVARFRVPETRSMFFLRALRNAFRGRDVRQRSRLFATLESADETQPQLHPALLRLSAMISQYRFTPRDSAFFCSPRGNDKMISNGRNDAATTLVIAAIALSSPAAAAPQPPVTFELPCSSRDNHGNGRGGRKKRSFASTSPIPAPASSSAHGKSFPNRALRTKDEITIGEVERIQL